MFTEEQVEIALGEIQVPDVASWDLFAEVAEFKVYRRSVANSTLKEYKVLGTFPDLPVRYLLQAYTNLDYRKTWDKYMASWRSLDDKRFHFVTKFPWPLSPRDYVYELNVQEFEGGVFCINGQSVVDESMPEKSGTVRVDDFRQDVVIQPTENAKGCNIWFAYFDDPKGNVPSSIINWAAKSGVPGFLNSLRDAGLSLMKEDLTKEKTKLPHSSDSAVSINKAILSKKGPLAKVWLAAHWERKLSKNQLLQTNLNNSVDAIIGVDQAPMALRLSGQLLLGVTRIYSRKTKYLLEDCNEALVKIKVAFRSDANNMGDSLLMLDGASDLPTEHSRAAFNAITVQDNMTEFDLLLPAQTIDLDAWGLQSKLGGSSVIQEYGSGIDSTSDLFSSVGNLDRSRRLHSMDIETGRSYMSRVGSGGGYNTMDFDLGVPDDVLDLNIFGSDIASATDFDFLRRPHRRDDLEIEVGRREVVQRRSASVDPFAVLGDMEKRGREPSIDVSVHGGALDEPDFGFAAVDGNRSPLHLDFEEGLDEGPGRGQHQQQHLTVAKKRKLIVDEETELLTPSTELIAEGLLMTHEMLPRSRKLLRLQQIEQDTAHGGLAGYLLDHSISPRVMGGALVPELASIFSRQLEPVVPEGRPATNIGADWHQDGPVGDWMEPQRRGAGNGAFGVEDTTPPPASEMFGVRLESPAKEGAVSSEGQVQTTTAKESTATPLFQDIDDASRSVSKTKELNGAVFSYSTVQTMRLIHQRLEAHKSAAKETESTRPARATRQTLMAGASSPLNKDSTHVAFSEILSADIHTDRDPQATEVPKKRNRGDAAKLFFELLVLSTKDIVKVEQKQSFGDISVGGSPWLNSLVEADTITTGSTEGTGMIVLPSA
ncbi:sister chromatid cohesion protein 1 [Lunasporangiospora selenospora]|uniref:Phosphatidylcholine transfer protein n=1 Tax=Lunasporangiospora selenospora TaxID=979761 RepID=A0A9P6KEL9_9FUNG|nr:sister chromatid cohesion protein 1 [Lunasporangiospora selenospora]